MTYTTTNTVAPPQKTMTEIVKDIDAALAAPRLIGFVMGFAVYADGKMPDRMVEFRGDDGEPIMRFRADHPYLDGTKFAAAVRRW